MTNIGLELEDINFEEIIKAINTLNADDVFNGLLDHGLFPEKIPPCFNTKGLANFLESRKQCEFDFSNEVKLNRSTQKSHDYMRYDSLRDTNIPRHMGIPHPEAHALQVNAIKYCWTEIYSIYEKPVKKFSRIYPRKSKSGKIFEMSYRGDDREFLEEQEIEWMIGAQYVAKADIASCFHSIYTHSIAWAMHGKEISKLSNKITNPDGSISHGNMLDKFTQNTKDRQTNGILIGPHTSSVISEIILSAIDDLLQSKGYAKVTRHIDDYAFYASNYAEAEQFLKDLASTLRKYDLSLNERKTKILSLPRPSVENWTRRLNGFIFQRNNLNQIEFSSIRTFLDLALECSLTIEKSTPLNYAIKILGGNEVDNKELTIRAKKLYTQEAINLAIAFPYLIPTLDFYVFRKCWHEGINEKIKKFVISALRLGIRKVYPDAIAHAIYYALKYKISLDEIKENEFTDIIELDDCITNVLLHRYSIVAENKILERYIKKYTDNLKRQDNNSRDRNWLLIFQLWTVEDLNGTGQKFLAELKKEGFEFLSINFFEPPETS